MKEVLNITLIVNTTASSFSPRKLKVIETALNNFGNLRIENTKKRGHAIEIAKKCAENTEDKRIICQ